MKGNIFLYYNIPTYLRLAGYLKTCSQSGESVRPGKDKFSPVLKGGKNEN